jgi:hypothetical protein
MVEIVNLLGHYWANLDLYPPVADLLDLDFRDEDLSSFIGLSSFPSGKTPSAERKRTETYAKFQEEVVEAAERYEVVRTRRAAVLSRYDIEVCSAGDETQAVRSAISIRYNQLMFALRCVAGVKRLYPALDREVETTSPRTDDQPVLTIVQPASFQQLSLF